MIESVSLDLYLLRRYMHAVEAVKAGLMSLTVLARRQQFDVQLLDAFAAASYKELDYEHEGANQERMTRELRAALGSRQFERIRIPKVHWQVTSRKVLVTEWIEGEQLAKSPPEVIEKLVGIGVGCFMAQLVDIGFFHSDPHPGNLLVDEQGRLCLIDFGLCAEVAPPDMRGMVSAIVHLMEGDVEGLLTDAQSLGFLPSRMEDEDLDKLLVVLIEIFDKAQLQRNLKVSKFKTAQRRQQFKAVSRQLNQVFFDFPFSVPDYFALITRALIVLEGIAVKANPEFDIFESAYPHASKRAMSVLGLNDVMRLTQAASHQPELELIVRDMKLKGTHTVSAS